MQDDVSRLVGLEGFVVTAIEEVGLRLDLHVELLERATACPHCRGVEVAVKQRPRVRVRDLPVAGRPTFLVWRKRRYECRECGRSFTEPTISCPRASA
jgi:transposase